MNRLTASAERGIEIVTTSGQVTPAKSLVLSTFTGIGLLDEGFTEAGFCVVSAGDRLWGKDIRKFHPAPGHFAGVIGGPPCQDFSAARRCAPTGEGLELLREFARVVMEAAPDWFLCENVARVPDLAAVCDLTGYRIQRLMLNAKDCGSTQNRPRCIQFGWRDALSPLVIRRDARPRHATAQRCAMASEGRHGNRRDFADFCALQGLPREFDLPGLTVSAKYRAVGNGVDLRMARVIAQAVSDRTSSPVRICVCGCGEPVRAGVLHAGFACRKRTSRARVTHRGAGGLVESLLLPLMANG